MVTSVPAWGALKGRGFSRALYIVFKVLRHGWEAVPFQNSDAQSFSASCKSRACLQILGMPVRS
jgi:hypothetical protein